MPSVSVVGTFKGMNFANTPGDVPPDTIAAAGPTEIVETVNTDIAIYKKDGTAVLSPTDLSTFFNGKLTGNALSDCYVGYNELTSQFFVSILDLNIDSFFGTVDSDAFVYAVSKNDHPAGASDFNMYSVDLTNNDPAGAGNFWADFPRVGWNANAYVASFNMFDVFVNTLSENYDHPLVLNINSSTPSTTTLVDVSGGVANATVAPATMHGASTSDPMYFVEEKLDSSGNPTGNALRVLSETNLFTTPSFTSTDVSLPTADDYLAPPSASQKGSTTLIQTNDSRILNVEWRDNHLVAAQTIGVSADSLAHARWYEFDTSATPKLVQDGTIGVGSGSNSYFPSIAIGANDVFGLDYMQSSSSEYMSMYVTGRVSSDASGTMETPVEAQAGQATYSGFDGSPYRAGDFSGITVDPSDGSFWAANEYATSDTTSQANWGTAIANFTVSAATPPTISTISASPSPVTGTTTVLSVTASDPNQGGTITSYTWSVKSGPSGVTFDSNNGTSNGASVTATFTQAGSYTFLVTVNESLGASNTATVDVTVQQTLTSITVTPATTAVADGKTKQFSATALDQFGIALVTQPTFTWSVASGGAGTIDSSTGLYSAPASGVGSDTVQASVTTGGVTVTGSATAKYAQAPTVTQAAKALLSAKGTTASLSVAATDPNSGGTITKYAWSVSGPSGVTFSSSNGTSTGNNVTATFTQTGTYTFTVTITDSYGVSTTSKVTLVVGQVLTKMTVSPGTATVRDGQTKQFTATALDQFNKSMTVSISWKIVSGAGSISSTGLYTAPSSGTGTVTIEAFDGSVFGTATITLTRKHH
jgi:hypothetical protein